ncbi:hypothetical protein D3C86_385130 [compost metagenome]
MKLSDKARRVDLVLRKSCRSINGAAFSVARSRRPHAPSGRHHAHAELFGAQAGGVGADKVAAGHAFRVSHDGHQISRGVVRIAHHTPLCVDHPDCSVRGVISRGGGAVLRMRGQRGKHGVGSARNARVQPCRMADDLHHVSIRIQNPARGRACRVYAENLPSKAVIHPIAGTVFQASQDAPGIGRRRDRRCILNLANQVTGSVIDALRDGAQAVHHVGETTDSVVGIHGANVACGIRHCRQCRVDGRGRQRHVGRYPDRVGDSLDDLAVGVITLAHDSACAIHLQNDPAESIVDHAFALVISDIQSWRGGHIRRANTGRRKAVGVGGAFRDIAAGVVAVRHYRPQRIDGHCQTTVSTEIAILELVDGLR